MFNMKVLPSTMDGCKDGQWTACPNQTNMTDYKDPYATPLDQNGWTAAGGRGRAGTRTNEGIVPDKYVRMDRQYL